MVLEIKWCIWNNLFTLQISHTLSFINDENDTVNNLSTPLTTGRIHQDNCNILSNAHSSTNYDKTSELIYHVNIISTYPHFTNMIKTK